MKTITLIFFSIIIFSVSAQQYQWAKNIGSPSNDLPRVVKADGSGNVYVAGGFRDSADFDPGPGTTKLVSKGMADAFLAKYTSTGDFVWAFSFGDIYDSEILDLVIDGEGNIVVTGSFMETVDLDPGPGSFLVTSVMSNNDGFLAKYSPAGAFIWGFSFGNYNNDYGRDLAINANNDIYVAGYFNQTVDFDPGAGTANLTGQFDIFVAKYDKNANYLWAFKIGANGQEYTHGIALDAAENLCIFGRFQQTIDFDPGNGTANLTASSNHDLFLAKYSSAGNYLWANQLSGPGSKYGRGISTDNNNNIYISGSYNNSLDFDPSANTAISTPTSVSPFAAKYDMQGNYVWHHVFVCSTGGSSSSGNIVYHNNHAYITGAFTGLLNDTINGSPVSIPSQGAEDIFLGKLNATDGKIVWLQTTGSADMDNATNITVLPSDEIYVCGIFSQTCDFNFDSQATNNLSSNGSGDIFIAKYNVFGVGIEKIMNQKAVFTIYPNPSVGQFTIQSEQAGIFELVNLTGRSIQTYQLQMHSSLNITENLPSGMYFIRERESGAVQKLIIY